MTHRFSFTILTLQLAWCFLMGLTPTGDHRGTEFLLSFMKNGYGQGKAYIIIMAEDTADVEIINHWTSVTTTQTIAGGSSFQLELTSSIRYESTAEDIEKKTVTVQSSASVSVYVIDYNSYSSEGYLAIPVKYLSTRYLAVSYTKNKYLPTILTAAVEDETEVTITFKIQNGGTCSSGLYTDGTSASYKLNSKEAFGIFCTEDLTGTYVSSTKPVTLISGQPCANVPDGVDGVDMLTEMMVPVEALGTNFLLHNLAGRDSGAIYRTAASQDDTMINTSTGKTITLDFGSYFDIDTAFEGEMCLTSNKPVLVVMYAKGKKADTVPPDGDGFMSQVPPTDRFLSRYMFDPSYLSDFTSYFAKTTLDGSILPPDEDYFHPVNGCGYSVDVRPSPGGVISLTMGGAGFGATVYGFMSAGGYGFPLGMVFDFDDCESIPCLNGGTCTDLGYTYNCTCERPYSGDRCETALVATSSTPSFDDISTTQSFDDSSFSTSSLVEPTDITMSSSPSEEPSQLTASFSDDTATSTEPSEILATTDTDSSQALFSQTLTNFDFQTSWSVIPQISSSEFLSVINSSVIDLSLGLDTTDTLSLSLTQIASYPGVSESPESTLHPTSPLTLNSFSTFDPGTATPGCSSCASIESSSSQVITTYPVSPSTTAYLSYTSVCACRCAVNLSTINMAELTKLIKKTLTVPTHNLSSTIRKKISIPDDRPSAVAVGSGGILMIVITTVLVTFSDLITLLKYICGGYKQVQYSRDAVTLSLQR